MSEDELTPPEPTPPTSPPESSGGPPPHPEASKDAPARQFRKWLDRVHAFLVRLPGDGALFELANFGAFARRQEPGTIARLLTVTLGSQTRPGSCVNLISSLESGEAI